METEIPGITEEYIGYVHWLTAMQDLIGRNFRFAFDYIVLIQQFFYLDSLRLQMALLTRVLSLRNPDSVRKYIEHNFTLEGLQDQGGFSLVRLLSQKYHQLVALASEFYMKGTIKDSPILIEIAYSIYNSIPKVLSELSQGSHKYWNYFYKSLAPRVVPDSWKEKFSIDDNSNMKLWYEFVAGSFTNTLSIVPYTWEHLLFGLYPWYEHRTLFFMESSNGYLNSYRNKYTWTNFIRSNLTGMIFNRLYAGSYYEPLTAQNFKYSYKLGSLAEVLDHEGIPNLSIFTGSSFGLHLLMNYMRPKSKRSPFAQNIFRLISTFPGLKYNASVINSRQVLTSGSNQEEGLDLNAKLFRVTE